MTKKHALLIGINKYPYLAESAQQKGCHNDVFALRKVLNQKYDFPAKNIYTLLDEEATRKGIFKAMQHLLENTGQNDAVVFHFSGHGSRLKTTSKNKPSGWYETIMPFDSGRKKYHPKAVNRDITDDEVFDWLMCLAEKTENITLIFDSCYAGSILRKSSAGMRVVEPDIQTNRAALDTPFSRSSGKKPRNGASGWLPLSDKYVLAAACAENQVALLYKDEQDEKTVHYGAFSYFLCRALRELPPGATYRDLWERVFYDLTSFRRHQHPQLEGRRDRELFGTREFTPAHFLSVESREENRVVLAGGAAHGLSKGSRWTIYPSGTKNAGKGGTALGEIEITGIKAISSEAVLLEEFLPGAVQRGLRAVEISETRQKTDRYRRALNIRKTSDVLAGSIDFEVFRIDENGKWRKIKPTDGEAENLFREGDPIAFNVINRFESTIYFSILDFGVSLGIGVLYPPRGAKIGIGPLKQRSGSGANQTPGGGICRIGFTARDQIRLRFPPEFSPAAQTKYPERFKLVVTLLPHDLSFLEQDGVGSITESKFTMSSLFSNFSRGDGKFEAALCSKWENEWLTIDREFFLRRT